MIATQSLPHSIGRPTPPMNCGEPLLYTARESPVTVDGDFGYNTTAPVLEDATDPAPAIG